MKLHTILVIGNEEITQRILRGTLGRLCNLEFAERAQEGIDLITERSINLVLLDIQMPEFSDFELLQCILSQSAKRSVPVVVMTGKETEEMKAEALKLGAADSIPKALLFSNQDEFKERLQEHLPGKEKQIKSTDLYKQDIKTIIRKIQAESVHGDFFSVCRKLADGLMNSFEIDYISFWEVQLSLPSLILSLGDRQAENVKTDELMSELSFQQLTNNKHPYMANNQLSKKNGVFTDTSTERKLNSEIGIPLFKIDKDTFIKNGMMIPGSTPLFGSVILKRNGMFTTKEYKILSRFVIQCGIILWELYKKKYSNRT